MLNVAAGGVDYKWFTNLNFIKLKNYRVRRYLEHEQNLVLNRKIKLIPIIN